MFNGQFPRAVDALNYYGNKRTKNNRGVTIPSQIRYVHYFDRYLCHVREQKMVKLPAPLPDGMSGCSANLAFRSISLSCLMNLPESCVCRGGDDPERG